MKVLITGAAGFIGGYLANHCVEAGCSVTGMGLGEPGEAWTAGSFEPCDIRDAARLSEIISRVRPDRIFHLAAQSYPTVSLDQPRETIDINVGGTVNLFECLRTLGIKPVVVVACSSAEYGPVASQDLPVRESHPLRPLHPYGVSKVAQDLLAAQYFANYSIPAIRIRIFNTTGPGKIGDVCADLTRRAVEIELGMSPPVLRVGNMKSRRALIDVRDMVRALWRSADCCKAGEVYNVGGDQIYSVQELIEAIQELVKAPFSVKQDSSLIRDCDEATIAGDTVKFRACSGWTPNIALATTLRDMLDWWRSRLASVSVSGGGSVAATPTV
ncbi:MAG TPA: GDP-mannose 4,6-dehydratase [Terriglobia bacterium]|jgi:nucleoside-diphosphate-sugar epimerase|nr:GDP-mannose 4,6-dehydratase [Terriglobia bacterium]